MEYARSIARYPVIYPMLCFAAYTGTHRSEVLRSDLDGLDFVSSVITIREKKRVRGEMLTRTVPMQPKLRKVLSEWMAEHPGSNFTFADVKKSGSEATAISKDQASHFFEHSFSNSKWDVLHG